MARLEDLLDVRQHLAAQRPELRDRGGRWWAGSWARRMRSGTGDGAGNLQKVASRSDESPGSTCNQSPLIYGHFFAYKIHLSTENTIIFDLTAVFFCIQNSSMTAEIISIPRAALHEQVASRLRQMLVEKPARAGRQAQ
jgi:hypothetical protein